jgi:hypothetical protein
MSKPLRNLSFAGSFKLCRLIRSTDRLRKPCNSSRPYTRTRHDQEPGGFLALTPFLWSEFAFAMIALAGSNLSL